QHGPIGAGLQGAGRGGAPTDEAAFPIANFPDWQQRTPRISIFVGRGPDTRRCVPSVQRETSITPLDQSEAPDDLETTRRIRQAVIQDDSLSFKSKNATIVTNGNRVVLTGPVNTRAEADRIKRIAQSIMPYRIEDRLEIRR
ncbi:MAG: BON domain-containing protein, partial [Nitrospirota bacterium]|nr:BON domain-containing protein [Nitrospirota bacterium]